MCDPLAPPRNASRVVNVGPPRTGEGKGPPLDPKLDSTLWAIVLRVETTLSDKEKGKEKRVI